MNLFTLGYEGADLSDFLKVLKAHDIELLVDVRELPLSRRKGFSKNALREALENCDIDYRHERRLGSPKPLRHRLYADRNYWTCHRSAVADALAELTDAAPTHLEVTANVATR